jgi:heparan-alpha-glucosaminide N-acetyltransferase
VHQPTRDELVNTVFHFWRQWLCILLVTLAWILITFVPKLSNCPRGYIGPGGKHYHGQYQNCTGGKICIIRIERKKYIIH